MEAEYFVKALQTECRDSAVKGCVEIFTSPPGRKPDQSLVEISKWFNALPESDREMVTRAMFEAADSTLFGILCVLDGVRSIEPAGIKTNFQLTAQKDKETSILCPGPAFLHDLR
jgi:hypothetical protein